MGKPYLALGGRRAVTTSEHAEQSMLVQWAALNTNRHPELALLFAIPNAGGYTGGFKANVARVQRMKAEGVRSGVPDLCLPVRRGSCNALYLEMKVGKNKPTDEQLAWHAQLRAQGNAVSVCYSFDAARSVIDAYLAQKPQP